MKVVIINTFEKAGGAAIAANRLMQALNRNGVHARMLVLDKQTDDEYVTTINTSWLKKKINLLRFIWERCVILFNNKFNRKTLFQVSIANTGTDISNHPLVKEADIVHLHWINQSFLSIKDIETLTKLRKPIVWTMHDMWPFTSICHHSYECNRYHQTCGMCPFLQSKDENDLSHKVFVRKKQLKFTSVEIVAVSNWLREKAKNSSLLRNKEILTIQNLLNTEVFRPLDKAECRKKHNLPSDKKIMMMGAARLNEPIKGFELLNKAIDFLTQREYVKENLLLILFGNIKHDDAFLNKIKIPYKYFGQINEPAIIAQLYASADVTIVPSLYETFGQTLIESMACGCPAVSFDNSGQTDIIDHKINGYLAKYKDTEDMANGIKWVLNNSKSLNLHQECIKKVQSNYTEQIVSNKYISLYQKLISR